MKRFITFCFFVLSYSIAFAQIGIGTLTPNSSSILDLNATDKAFLPPRMTSIQRNLITNPTVGMVIYNTDSACIEIYRGSSWFNLCSVSPPLYSGSVIAYSPVNVTKTNSKKIFVHVMPWFETPATNSGNWGIHWKMANKNPTTILANGQRDIASYYYPLTGPYASSDTAIIDYQLLLMKLSGIDGVLIDWPGTGTNNGVSLDLPLNERNTKAFVARVARAGLKYALVYEDNFLSNVSNKIAQAQADMIYAQTNYFQDINYEKVNNAPLLLVFGPQQLTTGTSWTSVFSVLTTKPTFLTLWYESSQAGSNANGEFSWIYSDYLTGLNSFYTNAYSGIKFGSVYPSFNTYYIAGGWSGPTWTIAANGTSTFTATLDLALSKSNLNYVQLNTWNDYGEGTMLEPTVAATGGFGYSLLTTLQQKLGVASLDQTDLEAVYKLYQLRQNNAGNTAALNKLNQVFYYMVSLQMSKAKALLATF